MGKKKRQGHHLRVDEFLACERAVDQGQQPGGGPWILHGVWWVQNVSHPLAFGQPHAPPAFVLFMRVMNTAGEMQPHELKVVQRRYVPATNEWESVADLPLDTRTHAFRPGRITYITQPVTGLPVPAEGWYQFQLQDEDDHVLARTEVYLR